MPRPPPSVRAARSWRPRILSGGAGIATAAPASLPLARVAGLLRDPEPLLGDDAAANGRVIRELVALRDLMIGL